MKAVFENKELQFEAVETNHMRSYEPMFHSHGEILLVKVGKMFVNINGCKKELSAGEMCVVFPYSIHSYEADENTSVLFVLFSPECAGEFKDTLLSSIPENPYMENSRKYDVIIENIMLYAKDSSELFQKTAVAYLKVLIGEILTRLNLLENKKTDFDAIRTALAYCTEHYNEEINVKTICKNVFVSERYITKIFSERVGCSFRAYINRLRVSKAEDLLKNTHIKITDVMYECGFKNQSTFNRVFLEETGLTPGEFKRRKYNVR